MSGSSHEFLDAKITVRIDQHHLDCRLVANVEVTHPGGEKSSFSRSSNVFDFIRISDGTKIPEKEAYEIIIDHLHYLFSGISLGIANEIKRLPVPEEK